MCVRERIDDRVVGYYPIVAHKNDWHTRRRDTRATPDPGELVPPEVERGELITSLNPRAVVAASALSGSVFSDGERAWRETGVPVSRARLNSLAGPVLFFPPWRNARSRGEKADREEISKRMPSVPERMIALRCIFLHSFFTRGNGDAGRARGSLLIKFLPLFSSLCLFWNVMETRVGDIRLRFA